MILANEFSGERSRRRYERATGPFDGLIEEAPVLIYDLNLGGGFVNSPLQPVLGSALVLQIQLPQEGSITLNAEPLFQHEHGFSVQFLGLDRDPDTAARIVRTVNALKRR